jgi:hypothetical protein
LATSGPWILSPRAPSQRMRLWAIVAHTAQAQLAPKLPEGQCESPDPSFRSLMASSTAWRRWSASKPHFSLDYSRDSGMRLPISA